MTRLARHTKARTLVTELAKLATQPTAEALQGVAASKQKTRGINKDQVFEVFDSFVNTQLSAPERITRSSGASFSLSLSVRVRACERVRSVCVRACA
jgi:hypothetical protein